MRSKGRDTKNAAGSPAVLGGYSKGLRSVHGLKCDGAKPCARGYDHGGQRRNPALHIRAVPPAGAVNDAMRTGCVALPHYSTPPPARTTHLVSLLFSARRIFAGCALLFAFSMCPKVAT